MSLRYIKETIMTDLKLLKVVQSLIRLRDRKRAQLARRTKREKDLQVLADHEYHHNSEQWEALNRCIKHQQDKCLVLICDLLVIERILEKHRQRISGVWPKSNS